MTSNFDYTKVFPLGAKISVNSKVHSNGNNTSNPNNTPPPGVVLKLPSLSMTSVISGNYPNYKVKGLSVGEGLEITENLEEIHISRKSSVIPANMTFARNNGTHVRIDSDKMRSFGAFIYPGTENELPIAGFKVAVRSSRNKITLLKLQVKDVTNNVIIASIEIKDPDTSVSVVDLTNVSKLPSKESVLELQASRSGSNDHLDLLSWQIL